MKMKLLDLEKGKAYREKGKGTDLVFCFRIPSPMKGISDSYIFLDSKTDRVSSAPVFTDWKCHGQDVVFAEGYALTKDGRISLKNRSVGDIAYSVYLLQAEQALEKYQRSQQERRLTA